MTGLAGDNRWAVTKRTASVLAAASAAWLFANLGGCGKSPSAAAYAAAKWPPINGNGFTAASYQGSPLPAKLGHEIYLTEKPSFDGRIIVLDFWATWCEPCREAIPHLEVLQREYAGDVVMVGISNEPEHVVKDYLAKHEHAYAQATDPTNTIGAAMHIQGIPHVVIISTDGVVRWQGNPHPTGDLAGLTATLAALVKVDPGVQARRAAEGKK